MPSRWWRKKPKTGPDSRVDPQTNKFRNWRTGDKIFCTREHLRGAVDKYEPIGEDPAPEPDPGLLEQQIEQRPGTDQFDVINPVSGGPINNVALTAGEAMAIADARRTVRERPSADG